MAVPVILIEGLSLIYTAFTTMFTTAEDRGLSEIVLSYYEPFPPYSKLSSIFNSTVAADDLRL